MLTQGRGERNYSAVEGRIKWIEDRQAEASWDAERLSLVFCLLQAFIEPD